MMKRLSLASDCQLNLSFFALRGVSFERKRLFGIMAPVGRAYAGGRFITFFCLLAFRICGAGERI